MTKQAAQTPQTSVPNKNKHLKNAVYILLVVLLLALAAGGVYARYVYKNIDTGTVAAREFYFTSDHLTKSGATYTLNPGTTSVTFTLKNYADEIRHSSNDIDCTVTTTNGALSAEGAAFDNEKKELTGVSLSAAANNAAEITLSGLVDGQTYTVEATGRAGYEETLTATFTVSSAGTKVYKHLDITDPAYVLLTVWTENVAGTASITFPAGLIPDSTDPIMKDIKNYMDDAYIGTTFPDNISFSNIYSSHTYRFFKTSGTYTVEQFAVVVDEVTAEESTP